MTDTTKIVVKGVPPYDGEYDLDPDRAFNTREWHVIKKVSGYMPLTISDGLAGGDPELFVALAVIAMCRDGKVSRERSLDAAEALMDAPFDGATIQLISSDAEDSDSFPPSMSEPDAPSPKSSLSNNERSGDSSPTSSENPDATPSSTGTSESGTWPTLAPTVLANSPQPISSAQ